MDKKPPHENVPEPRKVLLESVQKLIKKHGLADPGQRHVHDFIAAMLTAFKFEFDTGGLLYPNYKGNGVRKLKYYILDSPVTAACIITTNKLVLKQGVVLVVDGIDVYFVDKQQTSADCRILFDAGWSFKNSISSN